MTASSPAYEVAALDTIGQAELVRRGEVSPVELVTWAIERIEQLNPTLNAVVTPMFDQALAEAAAGPTGPFAGVPYLLKDLATEAAGVRFTEGSVFLRDYVSSYDSELVRRLRRAGLMIVGKTNTPEFGIERRIGGRGRLGNGGRGARERPGRLDPLSCVGVWSVWPQAHPGQEPARSRVR